MDRCGDAWHYEQWKLAQTDATEVNGRGAVDGNAIVRAIKYVRPIEAAPAVAENGLRRGVKGGMEMSKALWKDGYHDPVEGARVMFLPALWGHDAGRVE